MKENKGYSLFINLPNDTTHSLRKLAPSVHVSSLKSKLELEVGLPSDVYTLAYGEVTLDDDDVIEFHGGVRNGAVLKVVFDESWRELCMLVFKGECRDIKRACARIVTDSNVRGNAARCDVSGNSSGPESDGETVTKKPAKRVRVKYAEYCTDKGFVALYMTAFRGDLILTKNLLSSFSPAVVRHVTPLGRTALHAAAAGDHVDVLGALLGAGAAAAARDNNGFSPMDAATAKQAFIAERYLRNYQIHSRGVKHGIRVISPQRRPVSGRSSKSMPSVTTILTSPRTYPFRSSPSPRRPSETASGDSGFMTIQLNEKPKETQSQGEVHTASKRVDRGQVKSPKAKPRIKSAPVRRQYKFESDSEHKRLNVKEHESKHSQCSARRPFMAFRSVPFEELRPITVEYVPLSAGKYIGHDQRTQEKNIINALAMANKPYPDSGYPSAPYSSLNNSTEDLTAAPEEKSIVKMSTGCNSITQDDHSPRASPAYQWRLPQPGITDAGLEKSVTWVDTAIQPSKDKENKKPINKQQLFKEYTKPSGTKSLRAQSANYYRSQYHIKAEEEKYYELIPKPRPASAGPRYRAWKTWLTQKYEEDEEKRKQYETSAESRERNAKAFKRWLQRKYTESENQSDSDDHDDSDDNSEENTKAFESWLKRKQEDLEKEKRKRSQAYKDSVYKLGCTEETPVPQVNPDSYMRSYQKWIQKKKKYEGWKAKRGMSSAGDNETFTKEELAQMRRDMVVTGFTYEQWLGHKNRERKAKLHVTAFGEMSPRKW